MVVSDGFATLMVIVGFTRVKEVAFTMEIVGAAGGGGTDAVLLVISAINCVVYP